MNETKIDRFFIEEIGLPQDEWNEFQPLFESKSIKKNETVQDIDERNNKMHFLVEGTLRTFSFFDGKELTNWIFPTAGPVATWYSFHNQVNSSQGIKSTEKSVIASISYDNFQLMKLKSDNFKDYLHQYMEVSLAEMEHFYQSFYFLSAEEKYKLTITTYPGIEQKVNLGHLASFLGISQETLSRIRSTVVL